MDKNFHDIVEKAFQEAVKKAISETHKAGLPITIGAIDGIYKIYPNGDKVFIPDKK